MVLTVVLERPAGHTVQAPPSLLTNLLVPVQSQAELAELTVPGDAQVEHSVAAPPAEY